MSSKIKISRAQFTYETMSHSKSEIIMMVTTSQQNEKTQELTKLFHQTKKTIRILRYNGLLDVSVKNVLKTFAEFELNTEIHYSQSTMQGT